MYDSFASSNLMKSSRETEFARKCICPALVWVFLKKNKLQARPLAAFIISRHNLRSYSSSYILFLLAHALSTLDRLAYSLSRSLKSIFSQPMPLLKDVSGKMKGD